MGFGDPGAGNLFDLTGQVAVVTGGSRGIGRAIALRMAGHGARVVVSSRKVEACQAVVEEIVAAGGEAVAQACNIGRKEDLRALVEAALSRWGRIDTAVCNAAVNPHFGPSATLPDEAFDKIMASNVRSNLWLANMVAPGMAERGGGSIVVVSSIAGLRGSPVLGAYGISKAADMQLVRNLAVEWGPRNIRANCIAPGLVRTDFARALWEDPAMLRKRTRDTPLQRIGEPDEIAGAAVFLASAAGRFMTGQTMVIDGGVLAGSPSVGEE
ncbi:SDR family NAD(P)-dependent oxidoreductase [Muricoccus aerilatus]|uniref:SDR family NAD(P)-dependent oxidoreductase n=1 Tax=Muricoccus aerilatus TaxID=452982 RepID=UPI0005C24A1F|nr:SDR family oxidoreductase [Roseomonas aerilata]